MKGPKKKKKRKRKFGDIRKPKATEEQYFNKYVLKYEHNFVSVTLSIEAFCFVCNKKEYQKS